MSLDAQQFEIHKQELSDLIEADSDETTIHRYLEKHAHLLMRPYQGIVLDVATQWPLGNDYRADFGYWWHNSVGGYIRLIEIERPGMQLFTAGDGLTAAANHACQQLRDWHEYASRELDTLESMIITRASSYGPTKRLSCILVMGRRAQLNSARRRTRWRSLTSDSPAIEVRTWDGFLADMTYFTGLEGQYFSMLRYGQGEFHEYEPDDVS
jgi:hypothetical protein